MKSLETVARYLDATVFRRREREVFYGVLKTFPYARKSFEILVHEGKFYYQTKELEQAELIKPSEQKRSF